MLFARRPLPRSRPPRRSGLVVIVALTCHQHPRPAHRARWSRTSSRSPRSRAWPRSWSSPWPAARARSPTSAPSAGRPWARKASSSGLFAAMARGHEQGALRLRRLELHHLRGRGGEGPGEEPSPLARCWARSGVTVVYCTAVAVYLYMVPITEMFAVQGQPDRRRGGARARSGPAGRRVHRGGDPHLHLRLRQRPDPRRSPRRVRHGPRRAVLPARGRRPPALPHPRAGARHARRGRRRS